MTYKTGSVGDFLRWTKRVIADPQVARKMPKRWFDFDATAEKAAQHRAASQVASGGIGSRSTAAIEMPSGPTVGVVEAMA